MDFQKIKKMNAKEARKKNKKKLYIYVSLKKKKKRYARIALAAKEVVTMTLAQNKDKNAKRQEKKLVALIWKKLLSFFFIFVVPKYF